MSISIPRPGPAGTLRRAAAVVERRRDELVVARQVEMRGLEPVEVRRREHHLRAGHHVDRAARVMRRDRHVIGFRHGGDLLHFADAAGPGHVRHDVVGELVLEDGHEFPARVQALADRDRGADLFAHLGERVIALDRHRLLEPVDLRRLFQAAAQPDRGRHVEPPMRVDQDFHLRPGDVADQAGQLGGDLLRLAAELAAEIAIPAAARPFEMRERIELHRGVAGVDQRTDLLPHALRVGELALVRMTVEQDVVAHPPAEQLIDRHAQHLAADVPQRDVDAADAMARGAAASHVGEAAEHLVPDLLDVGRIVADQQVVELADDVRHHAVRDRCRGGDLAPAGDTGVSRHFDEKKLAPVGARRVDQPRFQLRNLHRRAVPHPASWRAGMRSTLAPMTFPRPASLGTGLCGIIHAGRLAATLHQYSHRGSTPCGEKMSTVLGSAVGEFVAHDLALRSGLESRLGGQAQRARANGGLVAMPPKADAFCSL